MSSEKLKGENSKQKIEEGEASEKCEIDSNRENLIV